MPKPMSGNFASVFSLETATGRRYALKCFTRYVSDQELRYHEISSQLSKLSIAQLSQPWKMGFEYLHDGILVNGSRYPVLKMEWVEATTLANWLEQNYSNKAATRRLAQRFADLTVDLDKAGIAHGDLQHGNLLVASDGTFRLVDYDGMYVPGMRGLRASENGHRHYQSPSRSPADFGPTMDRFSAWVIYLSLLALSVDPGLWGRLHEPGGEYLLLAEDDFKSPDTAPRFPELLSHTDQSVRDLAQAVRSLTWQPLDSLPPLSTSQPVAPKQPAVGVPSARATSTSPTHPAGARTGGLPGWLTSHISIEGAPSPSPVPVSAATTGPTKAEFAGRRFFDVLLVLLLPLSVLIPALLDVTGLLAPGTFPGTLAATVGGVLALSIVGRRTRAESREALSRVRELREQRRAAANPSAEADRIQRERETFERTESIRATAVAKKRQELNDRLVREVATIEATRAGAVQAVDKKLASLDGELQTALKKALAPRQRAYVENELRKALISRASLSSIGEKMIANLADHGIRTAADFVDFRLAIGGGGNTTALLVLPSGRTTRVSGIGPERARVLKDWRDRRELLAANSCPIQLTRQERDDIKSQFNRKRIKLEDERATAAATAHKMRDDAKRRTQRELEVLELEDAAAVTRARTKRSSFDQRLADLQNSRLNLAVVDDALGRARHDKHGLSHSRYLHFIFTGH
ncbi:hypothetical protein ACWDWO_06305 [Actinopolymorpha singaporensis]